MIGEKIGTITVISRAEDKTVSKRVRPFWNTVCDCGGTQIQSQMLLVNRRNNNRHLTCLHCAQVSAARGRITTRWYARKDGRIWSYTLRKYLTQNQIRKYWGVVVNQKKKYVHRLVAEQHIPNPEGKPQINHIDGNPSNNHVSNLEWTTQSENTQHAYDTGLNRCSDYQKEQIAKSNKRRKFK